MDYIPVEKKTVGFLPKRGNLSKAFSLEVRYHSTTNIQRYMGGEICIIKIQIYNDIWEVRYYANTNIQRYMNHMKNARRGYTRGFFLALLLLLT